MKAFALGLAAGAGILALAGWLYGVRLGPVPDGAAPTAEPATSPRGADPEPEACPTLESPAPVLTPAANPQEVPLAENEVWLAIGDGYVFGEPSVRRDAPRDRLDLYCQDIHQVVSLACPHGARGGLLPLSAVGLPVEPAKAAALLVDAPVDLPDRNLTLQPRVSPGSPGVGFVRAGDGRTLRLHLVALEHHPEALQRRARIAFVEVPAVAGGGEFRLASVDGKRTVPVAAREVIRRALAYDKADLGSMNFVDHLGTDFEVVRDLREELVLESARHLLIETPLATKVSFPRRGSLFGAAGIAEEGVVTLDSYSAVGCAGDMAGRVDVKSYGLVYIDGDLTGTVNVNSYATVIIEGSLRGTLRVRSYTSLLLRGRVYGTLDCKGSCWSTFFFEAPHTREDLERMGDGFGSVTLHLKSSDLSDGKHEKVGSWREVIVGDPVWKGLAR
jgi:hypothetical protein